MSKCDHHVPQGSYHCFKCFEEIKQMGCEDHLHADMVRLFECVYPDYIIHHNALNQTNPIQGRRSKTLGAKKGFPDLSIYGPKIAFLVEVKFRDGKISAEQKKVHQKLKKWGFSVFVCRSLKEFVELLKREMVNCK